LISVAQDIVTQLPAPAEGATLKPPARSGDWRREWQMAQEMSWFHGPVPVQLGGPPVEVSLVAATQKCVSAAPGIGTPNAPGVISPGIRISRVGTAGETRGAGTPGTCMLVPDHIAAVHHGLPSAPGSTLANQPHPKGLGDPTVLARHRMDPWLATEPPAQSGPRMHMEHGPDGAVVWLGLNGDAAAVAARAVALCSELRRSLSDAGQRLALVVCNGQTVYTSNALLRKELP
jgi:hypothetical protein